MFVIATAGHVDHGKSALVRALTGTEPDRWDEERRRGLTIDLGFAWMTLPSGAEVSFVDVPGHERFLGNMLAGLGPIPIVCFVVAADEGWQEQSSDHRDAVAALGIDTGIIVVTRADLAPDRVPEVLAQTRSELSRTGLAGAPAVSASAVSGQGLGDVRTALDAVLKQVPTPQPDAEVRLWVDRAFSARGVGTVVTGTLPAGTLRRGDELTLIGQEKSAPVVIRGLQSHRRSVEQIGPVNRAAANLRGVAADQVARGDALVTPGAWLLTSEIDVRRRSGLAATDLGGELTVHLGTAAVRAHGRPFGGEHLRLHMARPLPLRIGDRMVLRGTGSRAVLAGAAVLDIDPPALTRRGAGRRHAASLADMSSAGDITREVTRRAAVKESTLRRMGLVVPAPLPAELRRAGRWLVSVSAFDQWCRQLQEAVRRHHAQNSLSAGLSEGAAADLLGLPTATLLAEISAEAGLVRADGVVRSPEPAAGLGSAEEAVAAVERQLAADPFQAPAADELTELGLGERELAAAQRQGRLLRLAGGVVVLPSAPAQAMRVLAGLEGPFTTSAARQALGTTRRTAIPLLEHLDAKGWTRRVDSAHRVVAR